MLHTGLFQRRLCKRLESVLFHRDSQSTMRASRDSSFLLAWRLPGENFYYLDTSGDVLCKFLKSVFNSACIYFKIEIGQLPI